ncbi:S-adenosyl-L-methionine-dependent methyltransferase [Mycena albidolilacea]|uniref:S-adenosyl-L-methionine-dependent methyltransferase n=1 Tax=Mycena albidolilacea TaxID=1033008 RepID=A0AAD7A9Y1_9AGAR|nr:S-adenosyl-L-methionine-dependent methyltransferase [Mycena albidolilacea]
MAVPDDSDSGSDDGSERESSFPGAEAVDPELEELTSDDFPAYFSERDGRLFHSHGGSPYPLPVDTPEQERMNVQHRALFELMGGYYPDTCPVQEVLAQDPGRQKYALDLCTGPGKWTMDVAPNFPHVAFRGLDIVPIATRYPHPNVQFSLHDVNTPTEWAAGTFDLIHARSVTMAVTSYPALLNEALRLLRPRGLFLSGEWGRYCAFHPDYAPPPSTPTPAPALSAYFAHLHAALAARGLAPVAPPIAPLLAHTGAFDEITAREYHMPLGPWHPEPAMKRLGRAFRAVFLRYMASTRPMLVESGVVPGPDLDDVYVRAKQELRHVEGLLSVFHTVHARKI